MTDAHAVQSGRDSFRQAAWEQSYRLLEAVDRDTPLQAEDLERLATAAYLIGRDDESEAAWARAHQEFLDRGDREGAARSAFWLAFGLQQRGAIAPASGWIVRAERLLDEPRLECVVRGYLLIPAAVRSVMQGDPAAAHAMFSQAAEIARRFADRDLAALACHGRGRALIRLARIGDGVALLDEAMVAVVAGDVSPVLAGDIYCSVLEACHETFDLRRAYEWTTSLARWCAAQPDLVRYRAECLLYRAELRQWRGEWAAAAQDANQACDWLTSDRGRPAAGAAFYRLGEIHRLRGEFTKAEAAYQQANEWGRKPQPGLSLLRLAQGQVDAAVASIRNVLPDTRQRAVRARTLAAAVEIMLAAGDLETARAAAAELSEIAGGFGAPFLAAASAHAVGAVLLAAGDVAAASISLRQAWEGWRDLEMPYEKAQACVLMAAVCQRLGDRDGRRIELDTARQLFKQLDAEPDMARVAALSEGDTRQTPGPLSPREAQVLRLVAAGKTNRAIAEELFISDKTVARHVSNIFDKLGVSSRAGATAWAYQRNLI
jgi:DNA-binding CsgD family transcriptional regulator/tetratricopeptide (TPR) repeat protein